MNGAEVLAVVFVAMVIGVVGIVVGSVAIVLGYRVMMRGTLPDGTHIGVDMQPPVQAPPPVHNPPSTPQVDRDTPASAVVMEEAEGTPPRELLD